MFSCAQYSDWNYTHQLTSGEMSLSVCYTELYLAKGREASTNLEIMTCNLSKIMICLMVILANVCNSV